MKQDVTPLEAAAAALAHRDRSSAGLAVYLEERGVAPEEAAEAVERLERAGYVDDARFAASRAAALAGRGHGDDSIRFDLEAQGLPSEQIATAVEALEPERTRALGLLRARGVTPAALRRLAARGFSSDAIEAALGAAEEETGPL